MFTNVKRTTIIVVLLILLMLLTVTSALADKPVSFDPQGNENGWARSSCPGIQDGTITDSAGNPLTMGFDQYGYNYQAHLFNGTYDSVDRNLDGKYWGQPGDFVDDKLTMKWSDPWLANVDCNGDNKLDRGLVNGQVGGSSLGWETNHVIGDYYDINGNLQHYTYFVKIVWTGPGSPLWNEFTIIEEVYNDPAGGFHGLLGKSASPGFGLNDHWTSN